MNPAQTSTASAAPEPFVNELRVLAGKLDATAATARRRGCYGLEEALREAAASARSWARGMEENP
jgi:hypothetical protein